MAEDPRDTGASKEVQPASAVTGSSAPTPPASQPATPAKPPTPPAARPAATQPSAPPQTAKVRTADGQVVEGTLVDQAPGGRLGRPVIPVNPDDLPPRDGKVGGQDARGTITVDPKQPVSVPQPGGQGYINVNQRGPKLDDKGADKRNETIQPPALKNEDLGAREPEHTNIAATAGDVKEKKKADEAKVAE